VGWIDPLIKIDPKSLLVSPNPNPNKPWILTKKKVLIKPEEALGCSLQNKIKLKCPKSLSDVRREEEKKTLQVWYNTYL
jgi:hypothetical protein